MCVLSAVALLCPQWAFAQMQPYRAEYALRLGTAVNAARVGSAVQDLTLTCDGWRLKRDVSGEIALSATWKLNIASKLEGEEPRAGDAFRYRTLQIRVSATEIVHQIRQGDAWVVLDRWTQPGTNLSAGRFGFYLPGGDQVSLANFSHYLDLNVH